MVSEQLDFGTELLPLGSFQGARAAHSQFNVEMLVLAREAVGFTQKDMADRMGCKQSRLSKIEAGDMQPQENDIQNFIGTLGQERQFFFQQGIAMPASVSFYRKTQTLPLKVLRQCNAKMNVRRMQIEKQIGQTKLGKRELPYLPPETNGGAEKVAQKLRLAWGISKGSVVGLTNLVEDTGCVVVDFPFPSQKLDGLCIRAPQNVPIIFINDAMPKSRRRLSLAHELGHLVMHKDPHENVEDEAWDFAGEFLMPATEIGPQFDRLNLDKLGQLKKTWGVSMQSLLFRARKLGEVSESQYRFLWMQIGKCGYRVNEPFEDVIPDEKTTALEDRLKPPN